MTLMPRSFSLRSGAHLPARFSIMFIVILGACQTTELSEFEQWRVDRSAGCRTLGVDFAVDGTILRSIIVENFIPQVDADANSGRLRAEILSCESMPPLAGASASHAITRTLIRLDESQLPLTLSGMHMWHSYALHIDSKNAPSTRFLLVLEGICTGSILRRRNP